MKCDAVVLAVWKRALCQLFMSFFVVVTLFGSGISQAALVSSHSSTSTLIRKQFAQKVARPIIPLWQRTQWTLVSPVFSSEHAVKKKVALATPALERASKPRDLRPKLQESELQKPHLLAEKKNAEEIREEKREKLSPIHQIFGFTTLGLLAATMVIGQINAVDFLSGRLSSQPMIWSHRILSIATTTSYLTTLILALFLSSLSSKDKDDDDSGSGFDSFKWHRALAWVHGIGMALLVLGGIFNAHLIPSNTIGKTIFTVSHLAVGYTTLVSLGAATIMISFF